MADFTKSNPFQEAIAYAESRGVRLPDEYYGKLAGVQRAQTVSIAGLSSLEQIKFVLDQVNKTINNGGTFQDFQKLVRDGDLKIDLTRARLDNIFRTNVQSAYSRGRWDQQGRAAGSRPYLMYDAINDSRTRPGHAAMDGVILPRGDPFWTTHYPPNGYRCRCTVISLTEKQAQKRGISPTPPEAEPDEGWDYNPGAQYAQGVNEALRDWTTGDPRLAGAEARAKTRIREASQAAQADESGPKRPK